MNDDQQQLLARTLAQRRNFEFALFSILRWCRTADHGSVRSCIYEIDKICRQQLSLAEPTNQPQPPVPKPNQPPLSTIIRDGNGTGNLPPTT